MAILNECNRDISTVIDPNGKPTVFLPAYSLALVIAVGKSRRLGHSTISARISCKDRNLGFVGVRVPRPCAFAKAGTTNAFSDWFV